jgi:hypothetical protein
MYHLRWGDVSLLRKLAEIETALFALHYKPQLNPTLDIDHIFSSYYFLSINNEPRLLAELCTININYYFNGIIVRIQQNIKTLLKFDKIYTVRDKFI